MTFSFAPNIDDIIVSASQRYGINPNTMRAIAHIESRGNPNAKNPRSSAGGLFQFIDSTAKQYNLKDRFDPQQAAIAGAQLARDNARHLQGVLGREPTAGELYLAHQQGAGGASRLLRDPNARAVDIVGSEAIRLNGGDLNMTAQDFANLWMQKADNLVRQAPAINQPTNSVASEAINSSTPNLSQASLRAVDHSDAANNFDDPKTEYKPPSWQDQIASLGASLMSLDQANVINNQGNQQDDFAQLIKELKKFGMLKNRKGLTL